MNTTRYALAFATAWLLSSPSLAEDLTDHHSAATFLNGLSVIQRDGANQFARIHSVNGSAWFFDATVNSEGLWDSENVLGEGVFTSGPAAAVTDNGQTMHAFGRGTNNLMYRSRSTDGGTSWPNGWGPLGSKLFSSGPAAAVAGSKIHVFARDNSNKYLRAYSANGGSTWPVLWIPMGQGVFTSAPAAAISADGQKVHVFGRGTNNRIWRAFSPDGGATWPVQWQEMGENDIFNSPPAAVVSGDGQRVVVIARGLNNELYSRRSINGGGTWSAWTSIGNGISSAAPSAAMSTNGMQVHVFGREVLPANCQFCTPRLWRAYSSNGGVTWSIAWSFFDPQPVEVN